MTQSAEIELEDPPLFHEVAHKKKREFLTALAIIGTFIGAAKETGISVRMHYWWMEHHPEYPALVEKARSIAADNAEDEVFRRAFQGYDHPVIHKGQITGSYKSYSDLLAMFYLKGQRPDKYRENEDRGNQVPITVQILAFGGNTDPVQVSAPPVSAPLSSSNGQREEAGGARISPASW